MILLIKGHGFSFFDGIFFFCRPDRRATPGVEGPVSSSMLSCHLEPSDGRSVDKGRFFGSGLSDLRSE